MYANESNQVDRLTYKIITREQSHFNQWKLKRSHALNTFRISFSWQKISFIPYLHPILSPPLSLSFYAVLKIIHSSIILFWMNDLIIYTSNQYKIKKQEIAKEEEHEEEGAENNFQK